MKRIDLPDFDLIRALRVFVTVVDAGGFSAASERLGLARGQPSRYVSKLEGHLGTRLMQRTTRRHSLTEAGSAFYPRAVQILQLVDEAEQDLALETDAVRGRLRLSAPVSFGIRHLAPALADFKQAYPAVTLDVTFNDHLVNLVEEGVDLAVRITSSLDPTLVARPLATTDKVLCAAPDYLQARGTPEHPQHLVEHECLVYTNEPSSQEWRFRQGRDEVAVRVEGSLRSDNGEMLVTAAETGLGLVLVPRFLAAEALVQGRLVTCLDAWQAPELTVYAVYADRRWLPPRVRALIDFLVGRFAGGV
ncbi:LysR family transcriptional regulator [Ectothiorhodospira variabilis]|uniref:LysR family transcriptional regulator n=1 Tax=Ectothiorhodospira variabilis TaxID=505694 RepID=UPI001EFB0772|nr:LysR family transcriptional regulator [Ectothiorhodospira variabilis]MCG5495909.1 LysR family transcriptional regulator [Ectothiorhodospira variabilis]MCG5503022.1 LysR family transcriptional regulator [Ectothiorhodospira variabilis]MCG5508467.1 LysR family transcriptional regulator [Ectothiorhodospira variabilis]